jgi:probable HAF family extracellular repeat protein
MITGLGNLSDSDFYGYATAVSSDGSVVMGESSYMPFRWENGQMISMVDLLGGNNSISDISADASVIVGQGYSDWGMKAFRWANGTMTDLGDLAGGGLSSWVTAVSSDGMVVVGRADSGSGTEAFRWENNTMIGLGALPSVEFYSKAYGISADGSVVVGCSNSGSSMEAFRWENGTMIGLGHLPGYNYCSVATDVSGNGSVIVGYEAIDWTSFPAAVTESFIWNSDDGMVSIKDLLEKDYGLDLTGWTLNEAVSISADGLTIVGNGINPNGNEEAWIATIPEPSIFLLLTFGAVLLSKKR